VAEKHTSREAPLELKKQYKKLESEQRTMKWSRYIMKEILPRKSNILCEKNDFKNCE